MLFFFAPVDFFIVSFREFYDIIKYLEKKREESSARWFKRKIWDGWREL